MQLHTIGSKGLKQNGSFNCLWSGANGLPCLCLFCAHISIRVCLRGARLLSVSVARWTLIRVYLTATVMNKTPDALLLTLKFKMSDQTFSLTALSP